MRVVVFSVPKRGNSPGDNDDAHGHVKSRRVFAVADGATDSAYAGAWAGIIVQAYLRAAGRGPSSLDFSAASEEWHREVQSKPRPWFGELKALNGAHAAFAGLHLSSLGDNAWHAVAAGDCCFLQLRRGKVIRSFPLQKTSDFPLRPRLLSSTESNEGVIRTQQGRFRNGDSLILATDAMAKHLLALSEAARTIRIPSDASRFQSYVEEQRASGYLDNDDTTLIAVVI